MDHPIVGFGVAALVDVALSVIDKLVHQFTQLHVAGIVLRPCPLYQ
ncbi:hypothetical protein ABZ806_38615 [Spirillospora sp. NPDC047418]|jgi:hypothetical protein